MRLFQTNFTGGEWSELLEGQVTLEKYANACYKLENFYLYPHGPAVYRQGFRFIGATRDGATEASVLIPFEFSSTQAYMLEFGKEYIRFFRNQAPITLTAQNITGITKASPAVVTYDGSDTYANGDRVLISGVVGMTEVNNREFQVANVSTGNNTFELSGINSSAYTTYTSGGTVAEIYQITSPYAEVDLTGIKYCQSADTLYLLHGSYAPRKLTRTGHTSWTLTTIAFNPPATSEQGISPDATLTPAATTGDSVTFTAGAAVFQTGDVGRVISSGAGKATIVSFSSTTQVSCAITDAFASTDAIASGSWKINGSPNGSLTPSIKTPIGAICTLTSSGESETFTNILNHEDPPVSDWTASGSGTNEYYMLNTAPFYASSKPDRVYINAVLAIEGAVGSLGLTQWGWGDNDTLGYSTIYIRLVDGADPDTKSTEASPDDDFLQKSDVVATADLFRSSDEGKYIRINSGFIKITQYVNATQVKGKILKELTAVTASTTWSLESDMWSTTNGYPVCGTFFENRLALAGTAAYPDTVWGSVSGDYENFTPGSDASDSYEFTLGGKQVNVIRWIESRDYLILGTMAGEWRLGPEDTGTALTPTNVIAKQQTTYGCANYIPVTIGSSTMFLQRAGRKIREFTYKFETDGFVAPDMTILAEHISKGGIVGMAYQQEPASILWCIRDDGVLIGLTYMRDEDVIGWHRHPMGTAEVESIAVIPGSGYDELWAVIKRTINGATVRYVEMLEERFDDTSATYISNNGLNAFFVDSGLTYNSTATSTITGLWHLNGESVAILANGGPHANKTVSNGRITLDRSALVAHVGLGYTGTLQLMRPSIPLKVGTSQSLIRRIIKVFARVYRSGTFKCGTDADNLKVVKYRDPQTPMGQASALFTGDVTDNPGFDGDYNRDSRVMIVQDNPLPLTVVGVTFEVDV